LVTRAVLYCRVSTAKQVRDDPWASLPAQLAELRAMAQRMGAVVALEVEEQASGAKADRPGWARALAAIRAGEADAIFAVDVDRLSRSERLGDSEALRDEMRAIGARIFTARQGEVRLGGTADEEFTNDSHATRTKYERLKIRERTMAGRERKAAAGAYAGHRVPYGFRSIFDPVTGARHFEIVEEQAAIVREVCRRVVDGEPWDRIAVDLTRRGVPPPARPDGIWYPASLRKMVAGESIAGFQSWRGKHGGPLVKSTAFPAIVEEGLWQAVQHEMAVRRERSPRRELKTHPLSGIARCGACGFSMSSTVTGSTRNRFLAYKCIYQRDRRHPDTHCTKPVVVRADRAEAAVLDYLREHLGPYLEGRARKNAPRPARTNAAALERDLAKVRAKQGALLDFMLEHPDAAEETRRKLAELRPQEVAARERLEAARADAGLDAPVDVARLRPLLPMLDLLHTPEERRALFEALILQVVIQKTSELFEKPQRVGVVRLQLRNGAWI
jgi:site-specific DNA recombinase